MKKRTNFEKLLRNVESRKFYAEEVCWALAIAADLGLEPKEILDFAMGDYQKWSDLVDKTEQH